MKNKLILISTFLLFCLSLFSLEFEIVSFEADPNDHINDVGTQVTDQNGDACAVLRVETDIDKKIVLTEPKVWEREDKSGGISYFYISYSKRYIKFGAIGGGYTPTRYKTEEPLKPGMTYVVKLTSKGGLEGEIPVSI